jgi:hypothetical protein
LLRKANRGGKPRSAALSTEPGEKYGLGRSALNCPHGVRRYDAMVFKEETLAEATKKSPPGISFEILVNFYKKRFPEGLTFAQLIAIFTLALS